LKSVLEGPFEPERLPAQLIRPERGRLVWLVDRAAAGQLSTGKETH
jgi:6-phosphogluconolactonase